ncbi:MAG: nucleotidyltransferase domain-containing protein [Nitrospirae bacterium]|nr:nucleotidyltransferase domain-containing protein [Nitrospirota bacterium]
MNDFKTYTLTEDEKREIIFVIKSSLEKNPEIIFAYIFGSFVDPEMPFFRDIDIGIYVKDYKESDWHRYEIELPLELEKILEYKYPVDVNVVNRADILLIKNIIQGELLFTRDEDLWADFVVYHAKLYADEGEIILYYMKEAIFE